MLSLSARGFIRFDVEDYLTPESDDALMHMLGAMRKWGIPGSYGVVGKKAEALKARAREDVLQALREEPSLGFHSWSHSEHPTLAEELAPLGYEEALARFVEREAVGVQALLRYIKPPHYFTQPGGNWVPEALDALPQLGMDIYFTDSFNSYVVDLPGPYWLGQVLLMSFPVINPKPFGLGLPANLHEALALIEGRTDVDGDFMVMLHPTELVTREFWDAVNFSKGGTRFPLVPAPLRPPGEQDEAFHSFDQYLQEIRRFNIEWCDSQTLVQKVIPRGFVTASRAEILSALHKGGWGPLALADGYLSAAEALYGLAKLTGMPEHTRISLGYVGAPPSWEPVEESLTVSRSQAPRLANWIVQAVENQGRLPLDNPEQGLTLGRARQAFLGSQGKGALTFLNSIKAPELLHWDWPIFPEEFRPWRLWNDARRLAWTLKPALEQGRRYNDVWRGR